MKRLAELHHIEPVERSQGRLLTFLAAIATIVAVTLAAHWPALRAQALSFDDHQYVVGNPLVLHPSWNSAWRFLSEVLHPSTVGGYYQPLAMISLMFDAALGGTAKNLFIFHQTSLALHALNAVLVFVLLQQLFKNKGAACAVAVLFAAHPLTVEPIPWIGERKTLLATCFALASLIAYVAHALSTRPNRFASPAYWTSVVLFALALMSKPTVTMLPVALLLIDLWPLHRWSRAAVLEKAPFFALSTVSAIITYLSQAAVYVQSPAEVGPMRIPLLICHNILFYLRKIIYPSDLSSHYPFPEPMSLANGPIALGVIGTFVIVVALLVSLRRTRALLVGWLIFFVLIFPTLGVIGFTIVVASDKYAYFPSVGLAMILAWALSFTPARRKTLAALVVACLALLEIRAARAYLAEWETTERLYAHMLRHAPRSATLHFGLGFCHESNGRLADAERCYRQAIELDPRTVHARNNLGLLLIDQEKFDDAEVQFQAVIKLTPTAADAYSNLGLAHALSGKTDQAVSDCRAALSINPTYAPAYNNWGLALSRQDKLNEAIDRFRDAIRLNPDFSDARRNLAAALWRQGRLDEALAQYEELIGRDSANVAVFVELGRLHLARRDLKNAKRCFTAALALEPTNAEANAALRQVGAATGSSQEKP